MIITYKERLDPEGHTPVAPDLPDREPELDPVG